MLMLLLFGFCFCCFCCCCVNVIGIIEIGVVLVEARSIGLVHCWKEGTLKWMVVRIGG